MAHGPLNALLRHARRPAGDADLTDAQLLDRYRLRNDPAAFEALVQRHGRLVLAACRPLLDDPADVDDVFQATFLALMRNAGAIRSGASVGGWLYRVAYRLALRARADAARCRCELPEPAGPAPDLSWREAVGVLHEELDRLPEKFRLPLVLCYLDGRSRDEAAQLLGWSPGAVKGRLERARQHLRGRLERRGVTLSAGLLGSVLLPQARAVPPALVNSVVLLASRKADAAPAAARLAEGVPPIMTANRNWLWAALLAAAAIGTGALFADRPAAPAPSAADKPAAKADAPKPADKPAAPGEGAIVLTGKVIDPDGKPVAGAKLYWPR